jgi:WD40 repeat protein
MKLRHLQTLEGHRGRVWNCSWNPSGALLASCGEDTNVRLWARDAGGDDEPGQAKFVLKALLSEGHTRTVRSVGWSPCGKRLAAASFDGTVSVWERGSADDGGQFECVATLEGHENEVKSAAWAPSGAFLATCSRDKSVWVWDVDEEESEYLCAAVLQAHTQDVKRVIWNPREDVLASCSYDNRIKTFSADGDGDWSCSETLAGHESTVWSASFNEDGSRLASCSEDRSVRVWRRMDGGGGWKCEANLTGFHNRTIYDIDWCHKSGLIGTSHH